MGLVKLNDRGVRSATAFGSVSGGSMTFIKKLTASSSATLSFLDGASDVVLDDTYKEYLFTFKDIHPATAEQDFTFQADTGTNTSYNQTMTTTFFRAFHSEDDADASLSYDTARDQAQGTAFQQLINDIGTDNDHSGCGTLHLFNPSSATFVKHFFFRGTGYYETDVPTLAARETYVAGYFNTTTALTRVQFKMASGNIDAGDICLYGIK